MGENNQGNLDLKIGEFPGPHSDGGLSLEVAYQLRDAQTCLHQKGTHAQGLHEDDILMSCEGRGGGGMNHCGELGGGRGEGGVPVA